MEFSLLMSVYGREKPKYLKEAIASAMDQTLPPKELVLVGDGPLPLPLAKAVEELCGCYPAIRFVPLAENVGLGRALAIGLKHCSHDIVARMDTDDICLPCRFELQMAYLADHPECSVLGSWIEEFDPAQPGRGRLKKMPETAEEIAAYGKFRNPVNHMTAVFRRERVEAVGSYRHDPLLEDYDLWLRMLAAGEKFHNLPRVLVRMRVEESTYERRGGIQYFRRYLKLRREERELGLLPGSAYIKAVLGTALMTLVPSGLRRLIYQRGLRR